MYLDGNLKLVAKFGRYEFFEVQVRRHSMMGEEGGSALVVRWRAPPPPLLLQGYGFPPS